MYEVWGQEKVVQQEWMFVSQSVVRTQMAAIDALERQLRVASSNNTALQRQQAQLMESVHTLINMVATTTGTHHIFAAQSPEYHVCKPQIRPRFDHIFTNRDTSRSHYMISSWISHQEVEVGRCYYKPTRLKTGNQSLWGHFWPSLAVLSVNKPAVFHVNQTVSGSFCGPTQVF